MVCDSEQMRFAHLLFATAQGMIKRVEGTEFQVSKRTIAGTKLQEGDTLIDVKVVSENQNVVLRTRKRIFPPVSGIRRAREEEGRGGRARDSSPEEG